MTLLQCEDHQEDVRSAPRKSPHYEADGSWRGEREPRRGTRGELISKEWVQDRGIICTRRVKMASVLLKTFKKKYSSNAAKLNSVGLVILFCIVK